MELTQVMQGSHGTEGKKKREGLVHATLCDGLQAGVSMSMFSIGILFLMIC